MISLTIWTFFLFFFGVAFGYFVVTPLTVQFFGNYRIHESVTAMPSINSYISIVVSTTFATGLFFLLPIVIWVLAKIGMISSSLLKKLRRHAIVVLLILSAIITPPDVISQVLVTIPLMGLYELGIRIAGRVEKKRLAAASA